MKKCSKCNTFKNTDSFYKNKKYKDGFFSQCKECNCFLRKKRYLENRNEELERNKAAYDPTKNRQKYTKNKERVKAWSKEYYEKNKKDIYIKSSLNRKKRIKQATLPGFNEELAEIYRQCPKGYHVDHIVPLQGETVSGLHVPWNLQHLTAEENLSKGNKLV